MCFQTEIVSLIKLISKSDDAPFGNLGMRSVKESFVLYNIFAVLICVGLSWTISKSDASKFGGENLEHRLSILI